MSLNSGGSLFDNALNERSPVAPRAGSAVTEQGPLSSEIDMSITAACHTQDGGDQLPFGTTGPQCPDDEIDRFSRSVAESKRWFPRRKHQIAKNTFVFSIYLPLQKWGNNSSTASQ